MTTRYVTYDEAVKALKALPPDRTNRGRCFYTWTTEAETLHCAVGQALVDLGLPVPDGSTVEENDYGSSINATSFGTRAVREWYEERGVMFDDAAVKVLARAQSYLDERCSNPTPPRWGEAVELALVSAVRS